MSKMKARELWDTLYPKNTKSGAGLSPNKKEIIVWSGGVDSMRWHGRYMIIPIADVRDRSFLEKEYPTRHFCPSCGENLPFTGRDVRRLFFGENALGEDLFEVEYRNIFFKAVYIHYEDEVYDTPFILEWEEVLENFSRDEPDYGLGDLKVEVWKRKTEVHNNNYKMHTGHVHRIPNSGWFEVCDVSLSGTEK